MPTPAQHTAQIVDEVRDALHAMTPVERAELVEKIAYAVYDHIKFRVPDGPDSAERYDFGRVLGAAVDNADQRRHDAYRPDLEPAPAPGPATQPADGWTELHLDDDQLEVVAHLTVMPGATPEEMARDIWPELAEADGLTRLVEAVEAVNAAATAATGKPGRVIGTSAEPDPACPEMYVHVLGPTRVDVR